MLLGELLTLATTLIMQTTDRRSGRTVATTTPLSEVFDGSSFGQANQKELRRHIQKKKKKRPPSQLS